MEKGKIKNKNMLRSIDNNSPGSAESVLDKNKKAMVGMVYGKDGFKLGVKECMGE